MVTKWINARLKERTTLDGAILVGAGVAFLIFKHQPKLMPESWQVIGTP